MYLDVDLGHPRPCGTSGEVATTFPDDVASPAITETKKRKRRRKTDRQ